MREQASGAAIVYQHRERPNDEMRTWTTEVELSAARALELAREPIERLWSDPDSIVWSLQVVLPFDWSRVDRPEEERLVRLVFSYGSIRRTVPLRADMHIGELTHSELIALLRESH